MTIEFWPAAGDRIYFRKAGILRNRERLYEVVSVAADLALEFKAASSSHPSQIWPYSVTYSDAMRLGIEQGGDPESYLVSEEG